MTDSPVETCITTSEGEISFQEYFVRDRYRANVEGVRYAGAERAIPASGVIEAIESAEAVLIAPSNPITSIGPILAVPRLREALARTRAPVAAVSPIVGTAAVSGPTGNLMQSQGFPVSIEGVSRCYGDFIDVLVVDPDDAANAAAHELTGVHLHAVNVFMRSTDEKVQLARETLSAAHQSRVSALSPA